MKSIVKAAIREEKGSVFILVLVLLVVGGLVLTPLLGLMSTGLVSGQVYERHAHKYYAADAGVEDAIWTIKYDPPDFHPYVPYVYPEPLIVDDKSVNVTIVGLDDPETCEEELRYRILSTATSEDGSSITVDAHLSVSYMDFSPLLDYAIISDDTIGIQPGNNITGDVYLPDEQDLDIQPASIEIDEVITGEVKDEDDAIMTWPTADQLSNYYGEDVQDAIDPGSFIDIGNTDAIGPAHRNGDLTIDNTGADDATLLVTGTVYVTGNLLFRQSGESGSYTLNLDGNTIFVEGGIDFPSNRVAVSGSGCIIAIGNISFQPSIVSGEDDFVLVMSVAGTVSFQPSGDFTGCVAGNAHVQLQPGATIDWISPEGKGLDFPMGVSEGELPPVTGVSILSWEIS